MVRGIVKSRRNKVDPLERYNLLREHPNVVKQFNAELKAGFMESRMKHYVESAPENESLRDRE